MATIKRRWTPPSKRSVDRDLCRLPRWWMSGGFAVQLGTGAMDACCHVLLILGGRRCLRSEIPVLRRGQQDTGKPGRAGGVDDRGGRGDRRAISVGGPDRCGRDGSGLGGLGRAVVAPCCGEATAQPAWAC